MIKCKVLFIGTFLSKSTGTKSISEKLKLLLAPLGVEVLLVSQRKNQLLRMLDIIIAILLKKYDFAHVDVFSGRAFIITEISLKLLSLKKKKVILNLRGGKLPEFYLENSHRVKKVFLGSNRIITPSTYLKTFFSNIGYNLNYLPNFIHKEYFPLKNLQENNFKLLWVRAFTEIYNPAMAIEVIRSLAIDYPQIVLTMIGPDKGNLSIIRMLIKTYNLERNIHILGPIENNLLYKYYHSHYIYLNTTSYESFGVAVLEAASCGIPIISTRVGELPFLWEHQKDILFVEGKNSESMVKMVSLILNNAELATFISNNAHEKAKTFAWENIEPKWIELFSHFKGLK